KPGLTGQARFRPLGTGPTKVRLLITDQAGNQGSGQAEIKAAGASAPVTTVSASSPAGQMPPLPVLPSTTPPNAAPVVSAAPPPAPVVPTLPSEGVRPPVQPAAPTPRVGADAAMERSQPIQQAALEQRPLQ